MYHEDPIIEDLLNKLQHLSSRIENVDREHNAKITALQGQFTQLLDMNTELQLEVTHLKLDVGGM